LAKSRRCDRGGVVVAPHVSRGRLDLPAPSIIPDMSDERLLIVDDEPEMVENLTRLLRREGYRCLSAPNGKKGLELLEAHRPDLLLTDLKMPEIDGMELLRRAH